MQTAMFMLQILQYSKGKHTILSCALFIPTQNIRNWDKVEKSFTQKQMKVFKWSSLLLFSAKGFGGKIALLSLATEKMYVRRYGGSIHLKVFKIVVLYFCVFCFVAMVKKGMQY